MEELGAQVAAPIATHQTLPGRFYNTHPMAKKRHLPFPASNFVHQKNPTDNWNPKSWDWDSTRFVARPAQNDGIRAETGPQIYRDAPTRMDVQNSAPNPKTADRNGEDENLQLKPGAERHGLINSVEEEPQPVSRPNKRVRSGSPGTANYPKCQVDNCKEDLSTAKDYHRRHKVCEVHSKTTKALVGKQMQRFCQQCSRFHPLSEFDEGKRSCRRRLAGHNRRRRKTQQEEAATPPRVLDPCVRQNNVNCDMDIVNLLAVLASAKGTTEDRSGKIFQPDKDQLIQILSKINSLPLQANIVDKPPLSKNTSLSHPSHVSSENQKQSNAHVSSPSTKNFLAVLSSTPSPHSSENQSQPSTDGSDSDKRKSPIIDQSARINLQRGPVMEFPRIGGERSSPSYHSPMEDADCPLQLFSSSPVDESTRKFPSYRNYISSHSSNEDKSPMASPPVVHNLFPMQTSRETGERDGFSTSDYMAYVKATMSNGCNTSLQLFGSSIRPVENGSLQSSPNQAVYASSSGSDHSPSSLSSDAQDRTGRISFKLFDKDPSHLPVSLRNQVYNWLSSGPSEMESYIRPGCIVLSLYLSMPSFAWDHLEENLLNYVRSLIKDIDVDFWGNGRFVVHTDRQMASHKNGKIRLCKSWGAWSSPELISVSPVAIVAGKETSLLLRGRSLTTPGTRINCTLAADYSVKEIPRSSYQDASYDEISLDGFKINGAKSSVLGRIFIEVENGSRSTYFPVIIADSKICGELRLLEPDINDGITTNQIQNKERLQILHFLEELGWLFQRKRNSSLFGSPDYRVNRFKFLLTFSVEHGFCVLVKTILDILLELNLCRNELAGESLEMLSEIHLLNRAVRIRSRSMVDLLIHYSVTDPTDSSESFLFVPSMAGPGGITPLHLAACTLFSDDIVDALTSDPQQVGLQCWDSSLDANGLSPHAYASMRNNHSYNALVAQKLLDRKNSQISLSIENSDEPLQSEVDDKKTASQKTQKSCSRCAVAANGYSKSFPGSNGLLQRPYLHSMLMVAAVCVCVCLFLRGHPYVGCVSPFAWENLGYGAI